ncbi:hypothetical protein [Conexibacter woesei]|uniref:COG1470 family protein n=1 Tax=Conexibacter woesei TaxID=191495 RepID=UPI000421D455|nr:hypothetical protein [Conexibacter woesei]
MTPHTTTPHLRTMLVVVLSALSLGALVARPAPAAAADASWTVRTAANDFGTDRTDYGYTLSAGGRIEDGIEIVNQGTTALHLSLRPADAVLDAAGRIDMAGASARAAGVGAWVHLQQQAVTVDPGATLTVPFVLTPPRGAAAGDHVGGIVTTAGGRRAGLQIRLRVSGALRPALAVSGVHVEYDGSANPVGSGDATVSYTVRNTGNTTLSARQAVSVAGPLGVWRRGAGRVADTPALPPGTSWTVSAPVRDVAPALRARASVKVTPLLVDAAGSTSPLRAVSASGGTWTLPWTLLVALILLVGLVVVVVRRVGVPRRRGRGVRGAVA